MEGVLTGEKVSIWVLGTWDHHHWMPVKYGILIYVSHLGSSLLPWWATCRGTPWCPWPCPPCSSAGERARPQVWHINQDAILDQNSMVIVPSLWDSNWNFFPCQDALEVRTSSTTQEMKNQSGPLELIFIHILTYIEDEFLTMTPSDPFRPVPFLPVKTCKLILRLGQSLEHFIGL